MKLKYNKSGQFIVIAVLLISLMIISLSATMFSMSNYYRQEQWEEYLTIIEHVKSNTNKLVDISLASYTRNSPPSTSNILNENLNQWQLDLRKAFPGYGVLLTHDFPDTLDAYDVSIDYDQGLAYRWNEKTSYSSANTTMILNLTSIGLEGYKFTSESFLKLTILNVSPSLKTINVTVTQQDGMPVIDLTKNSFSVSGLNIANVTCNFDPQNLIVYTIGLDDLSSSSVTVAVEDGRGIRVVAAE